MVLSVVRGQACLATPALHHTLARRAAVGRPQHGDWDCCDIPTEAQLQMQRHAAKLLEERQKDLLREEAEAEAAEAKRDKELAEAVQAELEAEHRANEAREAQTQALKERTDVDAARRALQESELALSVIALKHDRTTRTGAAVLDAAQDRVNKAREQLRVEVAEAEEAEARAAEQAATAERAMELAQKERKEAEDAQAAAERERSEAVAAASVTAAQLHSFNRSVSVAGARPPPVRRPNLAKTKLKQLFQAMYRLTDADGDGTVDVSECIVLDQQVAEVTGQQFDEAATRAAWGAMDVNSDGDVSVHEYVEMQMQHIAPQDYEEMCTVMQRVIKQVEELRRRKKHLHARLEGLFLKAYKLCDVNNDGGVSMEECIVLDKQLAEVTGTLHLFIENESRRLWRSMDANGDGEVGEKEYVQHMMGTVPTEQHEAACNMLERALADVASLRRERRGYRAQLVELLRDAFQLCDEDGSGEVDAEECIKLDKEIAAVSGREYDEEATKGAFKAMDASGDGVVSFYEYTTLQLQLIQPEDYGTTVKSLRTLVPQVAAHRKAEKERVAEEKRLIKAAKAKAFNYRLEQILSAHGGAAAVVVGSGSAGGRHYTDDGSSLILGDGARAAVRGWGSHGAEPEPREQGLHWSGETQASGVRMSQLPMENLKRLAGESVCDHPEQEGSLQRRQTQASSRSWGAAQRQADAEIEDEETDILHQQLVEDLQRRERAVAGHDHNGSDSEDELTFGACIALFSPACQTLIADRVTEEYVEVAQLAAAEEGGEGCEDELDRELLRQLFDEVDADCSGTVTLSELSAHRQSVEDRLRNKQREAFHQDLAACEAREQEQERQARREQRKQEQLSGRYENELNSEGTFAGRYTVTLRGCDTPRLAYGVRGGLIAVVTDPLNQHADAAGIRPGDEVISVDGLPIGRAKAGGKAEAAAIQRLQGLRARRSVSWVLHRPRRVHTTQPPQPTPLSPPPSSSSSSSSSSSDDMDVALVEISKRERRLMGALGKTAGR